MKKFANTTCLIMFITALCLGALGAAASTPAKAQTQKRYSFTVKIQADKTISSIVVDNQREILSGREATVTFQLDNAPQIMVVRLSDGGTTDSARINNPVTNGEQKKADTAYKGWDVKYTTTLTSNHTHNWTTYSASGNVITATTCTGNFIDVCEFQDSAKEKPTLTLNASDTTYNGNAASATLTPNASWTTENGLPAPDTNNIKYYVGNGNTETNPINVGDYTAKYTVGKVTAEKTFTIAKKTIYQLDWSNTTVTYNGATQKPTATAVGLADKDKNSCNVDVKITDSSDNVVENPTASGTYTATATGFSGGSGANYTLAGNANKTVTFTIEKGNCPDITAPQANNLYYDGQAHQLVTAGNTTYGEMQYALGTNNTTVPAGDGNTWSKSVPSGTAKDTYYVWYRVVVNENYNSIEPCCIPVRIKDENERPFAAASPAPSANQLTYNGEQQDLITPGATDQGFLQYAITTDANAQPGENDWRPDTVALKGTNPGTYYVWYKIISKNTYLYNHSEPVRIPVTIAQADQTITAENITATYGDTDKKISASVTEPATGGGAISYAVKDGSENYITIDASTGALTISKVPAGGKAYVTITAEGNDYYKPATKEVTVTINKAEPTFMEPTANNSTYNGSNQDLVTAGSTSNGTMVYALGADADNAPKEGWSTTIPTAKNSGVYYVWYKVLGDGNHKDSAPEPVGVHIAPTYRMTVKVNTDPFFDHLIKSIEVDGQRNVTFTENKGADEATLTCELDEQPRYLDITVIDWYAETTRIATPTLEGSGKGSNADSKANFTYSWTIQNAHAHHWTNFSAKDNWITAGACDVSNCDYDSNEMKPFLTLRAADQQYDGTPKKATITCGSGWTVENNLPLPRESKIYYTKRGSTERVIPINAGEYTAHYYDKECDVEATENFEIKKRDVGLQWSDEAAFTYDGKPHLRSASVTGLVAGDSCDAIIVANAKGDSQLTGGQAINAGTYEAEATGFSNPNYQFTKIFGMITSDTTKDFEIKQALPPIKFPKPINLYYTGAAQNLVTPGATLGEKIIYACTTSPEKPKNSSAWSETIPTATEAGTYYVWTGVEDGKNYISGKFKKSVPVTIAPAEQTITADNITAKYGETDKSVNASVTTPNPGGGAISYAVKAGSEDYIRVDADGKLTIKKVPSGGKAYVTVTAAKPSNHNYAESKKDVPVTISKADPIATAPTELSATCGQTLADVPLTNPTGNTPGTWTWKSPTTSVDEASETAKTFPAIFTPADSTNYNTKEVNVDVTVTKGDPAAFTPTVSMDSYAYGGSPSAPTITSTSTVYNDALSSDGIAVKYYYNNTGGNTSGTEWTNEAGKNLNAGNYYMYAVIPETTNYSGFTTAAAPFTVSKGAWTKTQVYGSATGENEGSIDLTDYIAPDGNPGKLAISSGKLESGYPKIDGKALKFKFASDTDTSATITIPVTGSTNYNDYTITAAVSTKSKKHQTLTFSNDNVSTTYGENFSGTPTLTQGHGQDGYGEPYGTVTYASSDENVATVDANNGTVTIVGAGTAVITATAAETNADNSYPTTKPGYFPAAAAYTLTVNKKLVTVKAKDRTINVGGEVPNLSNPAQDTDYTVSGLVGTGALTNPPTLAYKNNVTPDNTKSGTYDIVTSDADAGNNYTIIHENGTLTINNKKPRTINAADVTATYGDNNVKVEVPETGGGNLTYTVTSGQDVVTVDGSGNLSIHKAGTAIVTVTAEETADYNSATKDVTVTINKKAITPTVSMTGWTYEQTENTPSVSGYDGDGQVTYQYAAKGSNIFSDTKPSSAGDYTVKAIIDETENYLGGEATASFTIAKAAQTINANDVTATFGGKTVKINAGVAHPDTEGETEFDTDGGAVSDKIISYAVKPGSENYIAVDSAGNITIKAVPESQNAYVIVTSAETKNYNQATKEVTVNIKKAKISTSKVRVTANNRVYDETEQPLVNVTLPEDSYIGGTMQYALGKNRVTAPESGWGESIPTGKDINTYYVWYKVKGDGNYEDTTPVCVQVSITKFAPPQPGGGGDQPAVDQPAPDKPVLDKVTSNAITVKARDGEEYSIDGGTTWAKAKAGESTVTFDGLEPGKAYDVVARMAAADGKNPSPASEALNVTTPKEEDNPDKPDKPDKPDTDTLAIYLAAHVQNLGWDKKLTELKPGQTVDVGTTGRSYRVEAVSVMVPQDYTVTGFAHVQNEGDVAIKKVESSKDYTIPDGYVAYQFGSTGKSQRVEAVCVGIKDASGEYLKGFQYTTHLQNYGWQGYVRNGSFAGTRGMGLRMEALRFTIAEPDVVQSDLSQNTAKTQADVKTDEQTAGTEAPSIYFAAHLQNLGWDKTLTELKQGQTADVGKTGRSLRVESVAIIVPENYTVDGFAHVQNVGDSAIKKVESSKNYTIPDGYVAYEFGTTGKSRRVEAVCVGIKDAKGEYVKGFQYSTHLQNYGWQGYVRNGSFAGTRGMALRMESLRFAYTDDDVVKAGEPKK